MRKSYLILISFLLALSGVAQSGAIDTSFNSNDILCNYKPGFVGGDVLTCGIQSDGKIIIGGTFKVYNGDSIPYLVRIYPSGRVDTSFQIGSGPNGGVKKVLILPDDKCILSGNFSIVNGTPVSGLIRLKADGSLDNSFNSDILNNSNVFSIGAQSNGSIILCGTVNTSSHGTNHKLLCVDSIGKENVLFNNNLGLSTNNLIYDFLVQNDDKVVLAGNFTSFNNYYSRYIVRLHKNGLIDSSFKSTNQLVNYLEIQKIGIQSDGKLILTGPGASGSYGVTRTLSSGVVDVTFLGTTNLTIGEVGNMHVLSNDKILLLAIFQFSSYGYGINYSPVLLLNSDGIIDTVCVRYYKPSDLYLTDRLFDVFPLSPSAYFIIGGFKYYKHMLSNNIVKVGSDGLIDHTFNKVTSADDRVKSIAYYQGKIIVGGDFTRYDGVKTNSLARLHSNGMIDTTFVVDTSLYRTQIIDQVEVLNDGKILASGYFQFNKNYKATPLLKFNQDGSIDTTFKLFDFGANGFCSRFIEQPDGKMILSGSFDIANPPFINVRINSDGSIDSTFDAAMNSNYFNGMITSMALQPDGKYIVGGSFSIYGYNYPASSGLARFLSNGRLDSTFVPNYTLTGQVFAIALQSDGKILADGYYNNFGFSYKLERFNPDGSIDNLFTPSYAMDIKGDLNGNLYKIEELPGKKILLVGNFTEYDGKQVGNIIRIHPNGMIDSSFYCFPGTDDEINTFYVDSSDRVIIGGDFNRYNGVGRNRLARIHNTPVLNGIISHKITTEELHIYPNPTSSKTTLYFNANIKKGELRILDSFGKLLYVEPDIFGNRFDIDIDCYSAGMYIAEINEGNNVYRVKLIKQ